MTIGGLIFGVLFCALILFVVLWQPRKRKPDYRIYKED